MNRPVIDHRAESTVDASPQTADDVLTQIAQEEQAADEAVRAKVEQQAADQAEAEMADLAAGWRQAMRAAADVLTSAFPQLKPVWTAERCDNVGDALARCDAHYGWGGAGQLIGHPLVGLAVASAPIAIGTARVLQLEKARATAAKKGEQNIAVDQVAPAPAPDAGQGEHPNAKGPKPVDLSKMMDMTAVAASRAP